MNLQKNCCIFSRKKVFDLLCNMPCKSHLFHFHQVQKGHLWFNKKGLTSEILTAFDCIFQGGVICVATNKSGFLILSGGKDGKICIWLWSDDHFPHEVRQKDFNINLIGVQSTSGLWRMERSERSFNGKVFQKIRKYSEIFLIFPKYF